MIAHRRGRVIVIDETARRPIRLVPREPRTVALAPTLPAPNSTFWRSHAYPQPDMPGI